MIPTRALLATACSIGIAFLAATDALGSSFAGAPVSGGATVRAAVPLNTQEKSDAAASGNAVPANAIAVLAAPPGFDPRKSWPVLVVFSTTDSHRQNRDDLVDFYRRVALAEGWVLLSGDAPQSPHLDNAAWRAAMTLAAIDALHRSFVGSEKWPMACAGFSGGGKLAGLVAPLLAQRGCRIVGIYLTGVNHDELSGGYLKVQPGGGFLTTPIFISSGRNDRIAKLDQQYELMESIKRTGFQRVRIETFNGGHEVKDYETATALRWFRAPEGAR